MVDYIKSISSPNNIIELQNDINADTNIVPSCTGITKKNPAQIILTFASALSAQEESDLDSIITNHIPTPDVISVSELPLSSLDGKKLAVHASSKPESEVVTYAQWTGCGDDLNDDTKVGGGNMIQFQFTNGIPSQTVDIAFNPIHGRIWVHEAYLRVENGGPGDYIEGIIHANPTNLQTESNLDLEIYDNKWVKSATGGPGTGTHGFADANIQLIPRTYSNDGDWDYDSTNGLQPNISSTGKYKISNQEVLVHKYYDKIPCMGSTSFFSMTSDDTAELPAGYFIRITAFNISNTTWNASVIMEIYRERTLIP